MQKISFLFIARLTLLEDVQLHSSHSYPIYFYNRTKSFLLQLTMTCSFCSIIPGTTPHIPSHLISEGLFYRIQLQLSHIPMLVYHDLTIFHFLFCPRYLIFHLARFTKNNFYVEKNPTIVNFPVKNLELRDCEWDASTGRIIVFTRAGLNEPIKRMLVRCCPCIDKMM